MAEFVIYSAIVGDYDEVRQPDVVDERFDYILFSNSIPEGRQGVWEIRRIDYINPIQTKIARYVKTHPESLLKEYEASLWIDANIRITNQSVYDRFVELIDNDVSIASVEHGGWDCIYEELFRVLDFRYESEKIVVTWGRELRKRSFPKHAGMFETNLLFRIHSKKEIAKLDAKWWNYIDNYSKRDQLSFTVALDDMEITCELFIPKGKTVRNCEGLELVKHKNEHTKFDVNEKPAWLMHHYYKHHEDKNKVFDLYYWIYGRRWPVIWAKILGQYYRVIDRLK